jgi:hypothetical protein
MHDASAVWFDRHVQAAPLGNMLSQTDLAVEKSACAINPCLLYRCTTMSYHAPKLALSVAYQIGSQQKTQEISKKDLRNIQ